MLAERNPQSSNCNYSITDKKNCFLRDQADNTRPAGSWCTCAGLVSLGLFLNVHFLSKFLAGAGIVGF